MPPEDRGRVASVLLRVVPFVAALGAVGFTYAALESVWTSAPSMAPHVGTTAETIRLLILLMLPISPTTWMVVAMVYLGLRANTDLLSGKADPDAG
jgi:hypothetical protein